MLKKALSRFLLIVAFAASPLLASTEEAVDAYPTDYQIPARIGRISAGSNPDAIKPNGYFGKGAMEFVSGSQDNSLEIELNDINPGKYYIGLFGRISHHKDARTIGKYHLSCDGAMVELHRETPDIILYHNMEFGTVLSQEPVELKPGSKLSIFIQANNHSLNKVLLFSIPDPFDAIGQLQ